MAFRTKRRRKPLVQWLPGFRADIVDPGVWPDGRGSDPAGVQGTLALLPSGEIAWDAFPLTWDYSVDINDEPDLAVSPPDHTLQDLVGGSEWRLRRIVGKFFAATAQDELDSPAVFSSLTDAALGFIVCKTYDDGAPLTDFSEVNPLALDSYDDPWIWRRRWLMNPLGGAPGQNLGLLDLRTDLGSLDFPGSTAGFNSVLDGPHIDQKTARRIHRQERLFAVIAARVFNPATTTVAEQRLTYLLDYRLLGSIIKGATGNRRNASR